MPGAGVGTDTGSETWKNVGKRGRLVAPGRRSLVFVSVAECRLAITLLCHSSVQLKPGPQRARVLNHPRSMIHDPSVISMGPSCSWTLPLLGDTLYVLRSVVAPASPTTTSLPWYLATQAHWLVLGTLGVFLLDLLGWKARESCKTVHYEPRRLGGGIQGQSSEA